MEEPSPVPHRMTQCDGIFAAAALSRWNATSCWRQAQAENGKGPNMTGHCLHSYSCGYAQSWTEMASCAWFGEYAHPREWHATTHKVGYGDHGADSTAIDTPEGAWLRDGWVPDECYGPRKSGECVGRWPLASVWAFVLPWLKGGDLLRMARTCTDMHTFVHRREKLWRRNCFALHGRLRTVIRLPHLRYEERVAARCRHSQSPSGKWLRTYRNLSLLCRLATKLRRTFKEEGAQQPGACVANSRVACWARWTLETERLPTEGGHAPRPCLGWSKFGGFPHLPKVSSRVLVTTLVDEHQQSCLRELFCSGSGVELVYQLNLSHVAASGAMASHRLPDDGWLYCFASTPAITATQGRLLLLHVRGCGAEDLEPVPLNHVGARVCSLLGVRQQSLCSPAQASTAGGDCSKLPARRIHGFEDTLEYNGSTTGFADDDMVDTRHAETVRGR